MNCLVIKSPAFRAITWMVFLSFTASSVLHDAACAMHAGSSDAGSGRASVR